MYKKLNKICLNAAARKFTKLRYKGKFKDDKKAVHSFKIVFQLYIEIKFDKNRGRFIIFRKLKTLSKNCFQFKLK